MKKILICTLLTIFAMSSFAQIKGSLTIYAKEGEKIWVIKNGVKQNVEAATSVTIKDITDKYFKIKVIVDDEKMSSVDKQIQMVDVDNKMCNITYELKMKKNSYTLSIVSWDPIDSQTSTTSTTTTNTTDPEVQTTTTTNVGTTDFHQNTNMSQGGTTQTTTAGQTQTNVSMGQNGANMTIKDPEMGVDFNMNMNIPNGQGNVTSTTTTTTTTSSSSTINGKPANNEGPMKPKPQPKPEPRPQPKPEPNHNHHSNGCHAAMPASDFAEAKDQVKKASFADDKIRIAKQITEANCLSVAQIKEITKLFSFEDNKLDYLKFAYDFTFEKNKYYMVNDVLNFSSSKEDLDNYIKSKR